MITVFPFHLTKSYKSVTILTLGLRTAHFTPGGGPGMVRYPFRTTHLAHRRYLQPKPSTIDMSAPFSGSDPLSSVYIYATLGFLSRA